MENFFTWNLWKSTF